MRDLTQFTSTKYLVSTTLCTKHYYLKTCYNIKTTKYMSLVKLQHLHGENLYFVSQPKVELIRMRTTFNSLFYVVANIFVHVHVPGLSKSSWAIALWHFEWVYTYILHIEIFLIKFQIKLKGIWMFSIEVY